MVLNYRLKKKKKKGPGYISNGYNKDKSEKCSEYEYTMMISYHREIGQSIHIT